MQTYEYKVIPAPNRSKRVKGVKGSAGRFAAVLSETMNEQAMEGWEYLRSDSLPVEEKPNFFKSRVETYQTVLIFRRKTTITKEKDMQMFGASESRYKESEAEPAAVERVQEISSKAPLVEPDVLKVLLPRTEPKVSSEWSKENDDAQDPPLSNETDFSPSPEPVEDRNLFKS